MPHFRLSSMLLALLLVAGCDFTTTSTPTDALPPKAEALALSPGELILHLPGDGAGSDLFPSRGQLTVAFSPATATTSLAWTSMDTTVATVGPTGGVLTVATGTTEIRALDATGLAATASVTVLDRGQAKVTIR